MVLCLALMLPRGFVQRLHKIPGCQEPEGRVEQVLNPLISLESPRLVALWFLLDLRAVRIPRKGRGRRRPLRGLAALMKVESGKANAFLSFLELSS